MRACEGCRKRKIKCDGATTSTWPCGSCTRLKQKCNPPVVNLDRAVAGGNHITGLERVLNFDDESGSGDDDYDDYSSNGAAYYDYNNLDSVEIPQQHYGAGLGPFSTPPYTESNTSHNDYHFAPVAPLPLNLQDSSYHDQTSFPQLSASLAPSESSNWSNDQYSQPPGDLSDALGELKINDSGVGEL